MPWWFWVLTRSWKRRWQKNQCQDTIEKLKGDQGHIVVVTRTKLTGLFGEIRGNCCWRVPAYNLPGGPLIRVNPPSPYSLAAAVMACNWLVFIFDLTKIRNPTGKEFPANASGSNFLELIAVAALWLSNEFVDEKDGRFCCSCVLSCLLTIVPSSKYLVSGIVSARHKAMNSRSAV